MKEKIRFSPKQRIAMSWWLREGEAYDALICDGAVRSGKTLAMGVGFFLWAMESFNGKQFALCGRTISALRRNVLAEVLPQVRRLGYRCEERRSENLIILRRGKRENRFYLFGGANEASAALIQGITLAGALFDEVALMPRSFVEQSCARCSVEGSKLWFNCNPEGLQHWFYQEWILHAKERRTLYLRFTMEDNPSLSERVKERYRSSYSGAFYRRFILGEWAAAEGLIYDFFDEEDFCCDVPPQPWEKLRIAIDYGTVNATSFGLWALKDGVWYRVEEYYHDARAVGKQKTDAEYAADLEVFIGGRKIERVIVDPSAASFIEALRRKGIPVVRADNRVSDGLRVTADLLKRRKIVICRGCKNLLREMGQYRWAEGGSHDAPCKENDHAMDEMRYFAMSVAARAAGGLGVRSVERRK